jgi:hypothetical protein
LVIYLFLELQELKGKKEKIKSRAFSYKL